MNQTYENRTAERIYIEPVSVEDRPLPIHIRVWEAAKCASRLVLFRIRNSPKTRAALKTAALLLALAAGPVWLLLTLIFSARGTRRTAGAAC